MKIELDTLKCVKMLINGELPTHDAEAIVESLTGIEVNNLYNKVEIDAMLSETVQNTINEYRREFDKRLELSEKRIDAEIAEAISARRWLAGLIITCTLALAGYLSALIHLMH